MPSTRFVNITQQIIDDLSEAPFGCYRLTTRRSWKNLRGRVPVTFRGAPCWTVRKPAFPSRTITAGARNTAPTRKGCDVARPSPMMVSTPAQRPAPPNQVTIMSLQDKLDAFKADFEAGNTRGELTFFPILPYISELADQPTTLQLHVRMLCAQPGTQETGRLGRF
jgi:hypothetical protein